MCRHCHCCPSQCVLDSARLLVHRNNLATVDLCTGPSIDAHYAPIDGRLVVLAPTSFAVQVLDGFDDLPTQISIHSCEMDSSRTIRLIGWLALVPTSKQRVLADRFAEHSPVGALLDVGSEWTLLTFEVAEAEMVENDGIVTFDAEASQLIFASS